MKMKTSNSNPRTKSIRMIITSISFIILMIGIGFNKVNADYSNNPYLIMPNELNGVAGERIDPSSVFVQKVSPTKVENIKDLEVVDDNYKVITTFPNESYKAFLRRKDTKEIIGFLLLSPTQKENKLPIGSSLTGEFLFYQNGRLFNKISLAEEGEIYFYRPAKTPNSKPLATLIGDIEQGVLNYESYIEIGTSQIKIRRGN